MCGLIGWIKPTAKTETDLDLVKVFEKGLIQTQSRGTDATGYYTPNLGVVKEAIKAEEFVKRGRVISELADERFVLGHCRAASSGTPESRKLDINAHPFESKNWILIHNGTVGMNKIKDYPYQSDVDSEIILSYVEKCGIRTALKNLKGSATIVLYHKLTKKIYFWTDDKRPLALAFYHGIIFFASTRTILKDTLSVKNDLGIFPQISFAPVYEFELLEYDTTKNKFTRKEDIEPDGDDDEEPWPPQYRTAVAKTTVARPPLQRGCATYNMPSTPKVIRISPNGVRTVIQSLFEKGTDNRLSNVFRR
jgi:glucosamine 6-phosphate synthetase-like amidotransferase/phosphosugar isomerase protein